MRAPFYVAMALGSLGFGVALFMAGCAVPPVPVPMDAAVRHEPLIRCQRPEDVGNVAYWYPNYNPTLYPISVATKYVCKDHGPDHDGLWYEAEHEGD